MKLNYEYAEEWLNKLKKYWFNKDVDNAAELFKKTNFYQESPFLTAYTTYEEIYKEWEYIKTQDIKEISLKILAIYENTLIVNWLFKRDTNIFDGIYEIRFNDNLECIYFKSWEMNKVEG